jgi:hypothetical protein
MGRRRLITRRSQVQILPPPPSEGPGQRPGPSFCHQSRHRRCRLHRAPLRRGDRRIGPGGRLRPERPVLGVLWRVRAGFGASRGRASSARSVHVGQCRRLAPGPAPFVADDTGNAVYVGRGPRGPARGGRPLLLRRPRASHTATSAADEEFSRGRRRLPRGPTWDTTPWTSVIDFGVALRLIGDAAVRDDRERHDEATRAGAPSYAGSRCGAVP